jgi:hypothetical protein
MADRVDLSHVDKAATAAAAAAAGAASAGSRAVLGEQGSAKAVELATTLNSRAEAAASLAHKAGHDNFKRLRGCFLAIVGIFARYAAVTFLCTLTPFCFACGLLYYTEQHKDPILGFGPTHTMWRQWLCSIVIVACVLSWHAIFMRHQNMLAFTGMLMKYCSIAIFVVASYDLEAATTFCSSDPWKCDTSNPAAVNPLSVGNLFPAPYLDIACVFSKYAIEPLPPTRPPPNNIFSPSTVWIFSGGIVSARGDIITAEIAQAEREVKLLQELGASSVAVEQA